MDTLRLVSQCPTKHSKEAFIEELKERQKQGGILTVVLLRHLTFTNGHTYETKGTKIVYVPDGNSDLSKINVLYNLLYLQMHFLK